MAIHYKNPQTGKYEVIKIPVMKGDQGHSGIHVGTDEPATTDIKLWFDPSDTDNDVDLANRLDSTLTACYDYMGNDRGSIKKAADANVEYVLGEVNTVHYEGQHITATDTIEKQVKSATLKGQTTDTIIDFTGSFTIQDTVKDFNFLFSPELNKEYMLTLELTDVTPRKGESDYIAVRGVKEDGRYDELTRVTQSYANGIYEIPCKFTKNYSKFRIGVAFKATIVNMKLRGDLISVKMPILRTVGKNLFDGETERGFIDFDTGNNSNAWNDLRSVGYTEVIGGNKINIYVTNSSWTSPRIFEYDKAKNFIKSTGEYSVVLDNATKFVRFNIGGNTDVDGKSQVMLYYGEANSSTTYEPYKSNILTVNEDVVLRKVGGVEDTLDLVTGELTQRVGEVVLDRESLPSYFPIEKDRASGYTVFCPQYEKLDIDIVLNNDVSQFVCDKLPNLWNGYSGKKDGKWISLNSIYLIISIPNEELDSFDREGFAKWLDTNPLLIQFKKSTPIIKTVDLSDNHVYSYKDVTHYDCSSAEGSLVPTLSIDVPTNLSALVIKQRNQIETLEEENKGLNQELQLAITSSEENDNELLAQSFELDFRLMEVECALDLPMAATFRLGVNTMAMTPYDMAKKLILAGNYDRADMEHKLETYVNRKRMSEEEYKELIDLMNELEKEDEIVEIEPAINPEDAMVLPSFE